MNSATTINDLPPEMICELFEHLHPLDLLTCSRVNKRWNSLFRGFKVQRIALAEGFNFLGKTHVNKWYNSNQKFKDSEICDGDLMVRLLKRPMLFDLKYLNISCQYLLQRRARFDWKSRVNQCKNLIHLELSIACTLLGVLKLYLPKLKVLAIDHRNHVSLTIDCPNISVLGYGDETGDTDFLLNLKHPETIRKLSTNMLAWKLARLGMINVERLDTYRFGLIEKETLSMFPKLKEFHFNRPLDDLLLDYKIDRVKQTLNEFMEYVHRYKATDLKFWFVGFLLNKTAIDAIDFGLWTEDEKEKVSLEYVYTKNYDLIDPDDSLECVHSLDYSYLMEVAGEIPRCLLKFKDIEVIRVVGPVQDENHFLFFLKSLRLLEKLSLDHSYRFSQEFWNSLPASAPSLISLNVDNRAVEKTEEFQVNFDFIAKLSRLSNLNVKIPVSFECLKSLVRSFHKLAWGCVDFVFKCPTILKDGTTSMETKHLAFKKNQKSKSMASR